MTAGQPPVRARYSDGRVVYAHQRCSWPRPPAEPTLWLTLAKSAPRSGGLGRLKITSTSNQQMRTPHNSTMQLQFHGGKYHSKTSFTPCSSVKYTCSID